MIRSSLIAGWMAMALLLAGCAGKPVAEPEATPWSAELMANLNRFAIRGKVGFRRGETGGSANLVWQQEGDRYRLSANGPLGQGATRITGTSEVIRIENNQGVHDSAEPEALLADALGWPVSINSLAWWVRGVAAPGSAAGIEADAQGHPARIRQQDWDIQLDRWHEDAGYILPHRVIATGGDSRVTLLIERWEFPPRQTGAPRHPAQPASPLLPEGNPEAASPATAVTTDTPAP